MTVTTIDLWAQALGSPERMVLEVAAADGPWRVTRSTEPGPRNDVVSARAYRVDVRAGELWSADPALRLVRGWLIRGSLPAGLGAGLVPPLDWS